ncbi:MAG: 50S ribosomal protein L23 [Thermoanaerobaculia bacterium]
MRIQEIIRRPLVTEKTTGQRETANVVAFEVAPKANKILVKKAIESQFEGVKVAEVRITRMHGKKRRFGRFLGQRPDWKKAYVRLTEDSKPLQFFEGV